MGFDLGLHDHRLVDKVPERAAPTVIRSAHADDDSLDAKAPQKMSKKREAPLKNPSMPRSLLSTVRSLYIDPDPGLPSGVDPVLDILRKLFMSQIWWSRKEKTMEQPTFTVTRDSVIEVPPPKTLAPPSPSPSDHNAATADSSPRLYGIYVITKHYLPIDFGPENFRRAKIMAKLTNNGAGVLIRTLSTTSTSAAAAASSDNGSWITPNAFVSLYGAVPSSDPRGIGSPHWHASAIWATSGKPFALLSLPRELRDAVYAACCAPAVYPRFMHAGGWEYLPRKVPTQFLTSIMRYTERVYGFCSRADDDIPYAAVAPVLSLLLANKQVSREFAEVLRRECEFCFADVHAVVNSSALFGKEVVKRAPLLKWRTVEARAGAVGTLTRLRLDLDTPMWLNVLGLNEVLLGEQRGRFSDECVAGKWLFDLPGLKTFTAFLGHKNVNTTRVTTYAGSRKCHRLCTGMILLGLAGLTAGMKEVRILGCVSEQLLEMFLKFLREGENNDEGALMWDILGWDGRRYEDFPIPPPHDFAQVKLTFPRVKQLNIP
ncbi:hypothetical protein BFW01_g10796 [Lasiodiplodia theobromae]|uniref:Uncharacterized protein n=1 Tax=Lasiodiplodia theobromae TaxID=45133 RepID=A0A8H7IPV9_9PEZI|nr:hypothetical protein BFW01_g10796 [Lasiodiplodia theobromae]